MRSPASVQSSPRISLSFLAIYVVFLVDHENVIRNNDFILELSYILLYLEDVNKHTWR